MPTLSVLVACARHSTKPGGVAGGWGTGAHLVLQAGQGAVALRAAGEAGVAGGAGSQTRQLQGGPVPAVPRAARGVMPRPRALQVPAPAQPTPLRYGMPAPESCLRLHLSHCRRHIRRGQRRRCTTEIRLALDYGYLRRLGRSCKAFYGAPLSLCCQCRERKDCAHNSNAQSSIQQGTAPDRI